MKARPPTFTPFPLETDTSIDPVQVSNSSLVSSNARLRRQDRALVAAAAVTRSIGDFQTSLSRASDLLSAAKQVRALYNQIMSDFSSSRGATDSMLTLDRLVVLENRLYRLDTLLDSPDRAADFTPLLFEDPYEALPFDREVFEREAASIWP